MSRALDERVVGTLLEACLGDELPALPTDDEGWRPLLAAASFHGVRALLAARLRDRDLPSAARVELGAVRAYTRWVNERLGHEEEELEAAFAAAGVRLAIPKGVRLADRLYRDRAAREVDDIDLLIAGERLDAAHDLLEGRGYEAWMVAGRPHFRRNKEVLYRRRFDDGFIVWVDLHQRMVRFTPEDPLAAVLLQGAPGDELLIAMLCAHAASHRLVRLRYWVDVQRAVDAAGDPDWERIMELASRLDVAPGIALLLRLLRDVSDVHVSDRLLARCHGGPVSRRLLRRIGRGSAVRFLSRAPLLRGTRGRLASLVMSRGLGSRLRQLAHWLAPGTQELRQSYAAAEDESLLPVYMRRLGLASGDAERPA